MDIDCLMMLCILELHRGKSIRLVDGIPSDVAGINDISKDDLFCYIQEKVVPSIGINDLSYSINRLVSDGYISINGGRLYPAIWLIHYFIEILQYEDDNKKRSQMLSKRMKNK